MSIKAIVTAVVFYSLTEYVGLFRSQPATLQQIVHSYPFLFLISALFADCIRRSFSNRSKRNRFALIVIISGCALIPIGLWTSHYLFFQGTVIRMSQQQLLTVSGEYEQSLMVKGPKAKANSIGLYINNISFRKIPFLKMPIPEIDVRYISNTHKTFANCVISPIRPLFSDWTMVRVTGVGYSVAYAINDQTKREIDRTYVALKLFPPGAEDYFSPKDLGYYWHLRYYPDYLNEGGKETSLSLVPNNPMFGIRVVRNKDIIYNGFMGMNNILDVEGTLFSIKDVRPCVSITFIRDPGIPVLLLGIILSLGGLLLNRRLQPVPEKDVCIK